MTREEELEMLLAEKEQEIEKLKSLCGRLDSVDMKTQLLKFEVFGIGMLVVPEFE